ncbi:MAG TPA: helix-turn-helix transcriptional regulator [Streptosporangiaceae bacterium]|nr:helix-turn-helix transcriptional regulator [Streptosporangiaceae bacterium]
MRPVNVESIGSYIREQREQARISIRQLAQAAGVSNPYLSQVERGLRRPSADILQQIAKGLRISAEALYVQAGILDDKEGDTSVTEAIMADTEITERQKQMLIDIYESFRKEVRADAGAAQAGTAGGTGGWSPRAGTEHTAEDDMRAREPAAKDVWAAAGAESDPGGDGVVPAGADPVADAVEESGNDPLAPAVAVAEAEPWTDPPVAGSR